jgi:hypothetical protein
MARFNSSQPDKLLASCQQKHNIGGISAADPLWRILRQFRAFQHLWIERIGSINDKNGTHLLPNTFCRMEYPAGGELDSF